MLFNVQQSGNRANTEGVEYDVFIDGYIAEFRAEASGTQQLSELEEKVIRLLPQQTEVHQDKLAYHWQNFNVVESAVRLGFMASDAWLHDTRAREDPMRCWPICRHQKLSVWMLLNVQQSGKKSGEGDSCGV